MKTLLLYLLGILTGAVATVAGFVLADVLERKSWGRVR